MTTTGKTNGNGTRTWEAPGPGGWRKDDSHMPDPIARYTMDMFIPGFKSGLQTAFREYGFLLSHFDTAVVAGRGYMRARPIGAPEKPSAPPPRFVFKLLFLLHPEMRLRKKNAARALAEKLWRKDADRWFAELREPMRQRLIRLQAVDPHALGEPGLREHVAALRALWAEGIHVHFRQSSAYAVAVGDWLRHTMLWTGASAAECLKVLVTSSPASAVTVGLLDRLAQSVAAVPAAQAALVDLRGDPTGRLARLREASTEVTAAYDAFMGEHGWRLVTGFDLVDLTLHEMPQLVLSSILARQGALTAPPAAAEGRAAALRDRVGAPKRAEYDALLEEAKYVHGLRDDDVGITFCWPEGLMRRGLLAAGASLAKKGRVRSPEHLLDASPDEVDALLGGATTPSADTLAARNAERIENGKVEPPLELGERELPPPDDYFPPECLRLMRAVMTYIANFDLDAAERPAATAATLGGHGVSSGRYEGTARVVRGPQDFGKIEKGDILVAKVTSPAYNVVLPLLGAVVTDKGGSLCHTAIVAREFGIPGVVGTGDATSRIADGARIVVDGDTGIVEIRA